MVFGIICSAIIFIITYFCHFVYPPEYPWQTKQTFSWPITSTSSYITTVVSASPQMIDGEAFLLLTQTDIVKIMSIKLGPALKISNAILMFKSTDEGLKWSRPHSLGTLGHRSSCAKFILLQGKDPGPFFMCLVSCTHQREGGGRREGGGEVRSGIKGK